ncbi:Alpha-1 6-mannosyl-glycoprotein beta-1 2-N-acetylglucosaminyltransferase [Fasciolopsis buskii]|uniref:Alpha-1,6-mannosyl-glycoprotein 2-beta-N-acetylglucosaminyltransferase n=1 Tax=Fasciolopsis buskii TaxID=27845 RepID=A0A8E0RMS2_9TREM|nr:Alpha-1 6-mannosyl-glycoprotein beta-1 2-N-acetylglucosaminyltransferase [Fasciolopsis buski]
MFERLQAVKHYDGYVILLEEDHYVVEDILHVKKLVENIWIPNEAKGMIAFGSYSAGQDYEYPRVTLVSWISSQDNMGMGISRALWHRIKPCLAVSSLGYQYVLVFQLQLSLKPSQQH